MYMIEKKEIIVRYLKPYCEIPFTADVLPGLSNAMVSKRHSCGPKVFPKLHYSGDCDSHVETFSFELQRLGQNAIYTSSKTTTQKSKGTEASTVLITSRVCS